MAIHGVGVVGVVSNGKYQRSRCNVDVQSAEQRLFSDLERGVEEERVQIDGKFVLIVKTKFDILCQILPVF